MNKEKKIACDGGVGRRANSIHFRVSCKLGVGRELHGQRHHS